MWGKAKKKPCIVEFREVEPKEELPNNKGYTKGEHLETTRFGWVYTFTGLDYIIKYEDGETSAMEKDDFENLYDIIEPIRGLDSKVKT